MAKEIAEEMSDQAEDEQVEDTVEDAAETETTAETTEPKERFISEKEVIEREAKVQSAAFKEAARAKREAEEASRKVTELEDSYRRAQARLKQLEFEKERDYEERLSGVEGGPDIIRIRKELNATREALEREADEAKKKLDAGEHGLKVEAAHQIAEEYGLDYRDLLEARSRVEMEIKALKLQNDNLRKQVETKGGNDILPNRVDSGVSRTPMPKKMSDEEFLRAYASGDTSDHKRYKAITDRRTQV